MWYRIYPGKGDSQSFQKKIAALFPPQGSPGRDIPELKLSRSPRRPAGAKKNRLPLIRDNGIPGDDSFFMCLCEAWMLKQSPSI